MLSDDKTIPPEGSNSPDGRITYMLTEYTSLLDTNMCPSDSDVATIEIDLTLAPELPGQVFGNTVIWTKEVLEVIL